MKISHDIDTSDLMLAHLPLQEIKAEVTVGDAYLTYTVSCDSCYTCVSWLD